MYVGTRKKMKVCTFMVCASEPLCGCEDGSPGGLGSAAYALQVTHLRGEEGPHSDLCVSVSMEERSWRAWECVHMCVCVRLHGSWKAVRCLSEGRVAGDPSLCTFPPSALFPSQ